MRPWTLFSAYRIGFVRKVKSVSRYWSTLRRKSSTQVAVLNPNHLFEQPNKLITTRVGPPRRVDIRRAISAAYYATFHATITAAADQFIGVTSRDTSRYGL